MFEDLIKILLQIGAVVIIVGGIFMWVKLVILVAQIIWTTGLKPIN